MITIYVGPYCESRLSEKNEVAKSIQFIGHFTGMGRIFKVEAHQDSNTPL